MGKEVGVLCGCASVGSRSADEGRKSPGEKLLHFHPAK